VARLAADPQRRADMGQAARLAVEQRTWPAVGDELIQHYTEVHSGRIAVRPLEVPA
jgi:phosphatidylinositol alpha 1,6-mannosyltransferase